MLAEVQHDGQITTVCLSSKSDERYIVCGSADATLSVFDRQLNHRQSLLVGHDRQVLPLTSTTAYFFIPGRDVRYCDQPVCVSVCLSVDDVMISHNGTKGPESAYASSSSPVAGTRGVVCRLRLISLTNY